MWSEEYGYIIYNEKKGQVFVLGNKKFTPLELKLKNNQTVELGEKVYFGNNKRTKIENINKWLDEKEFLKASKTATMSAIEKIILDTEQTFIDLVNDFAIDEEIKKNTLQKATLLGPKTIEKIIFARQEKQFTSFEDVQTRARTGVLVKNLTKKIYDEISGKDKCKIFVNKARYNGD